LSTHITNFIETHLFDIPLEEMDDPSDPIVYVIMFFLLLSSTIINLSYRWFIQQNKIKNERLTMELTILKNQINPHFFFNTLNNLYALSMEKSDETPKVILKLSEMMRYTIYECQENLVTLDKEVRYLENYIELQKIRLHQRAKIDFIQNIENDKLKIAPMLLIVFLENTFKHGIDGMEDHCEIEIILESSGNGIFYSIKNNYRANAKNEPGMGIKNVKRRLDLIYPKTHTLRIDDDGQNYRIELELEGSL
jgi:LytS/YehU family sensor histidine kinase